MSSTHNKKYITTIKNTTNISVCAFHCKADARCISGPCIQITSTVTCLVKKAIFVRMKTLYQVQKIVVRNQMWSYARLLRPL